MNSAAQPANPKLSLELATGSADVSNLRLSHRDGCRYHDRRSSVGERWTHRLAGDYSNEPSAHRAETPDAAALCICLVLPPLRGRMSLAPLVSRWTDPTDRGAVGGSSGGQSGGQSGHRAYAQRTRPGR